ncbi:Hypothetical predicted protein [Olea europaea subsp. europaea]|uniref:Uncharacterized protein n=1 Tax=Olea europaea subsp. europaea TaxID=158383 RepID=A0A8S0QB99_OLEEU|nr:Hypothetical predicted protein [Olea europaea subsp. europaea]
MTTVGTKGDNQSAEITQIDTKLQESSGTISEDEFWISVENNVHDVDDKTDKPQIQRIPLLLLEKNSNKIRYDPVVVSIGPYYHGRSDLASLEKLKIPIAQKFVRACGNNVSSSQLYKEVAKVGDSARKCYEKDAIPFDNESFNKMMFLDACFVLQIMSVYYETESPHDKKNFLRSSDLVFVCRDLLLLENQIPFLVLKLLMKFRFKCEIDGIMLIMNFLDRTAIMPPEGSTCINAIKKFVQRMMGCGVQYDGWEIVMDAPHLLHLAREQFIGSSPKDKNKEISVKWYSNQSVTELESSGIHFRPSQTNRVTDVKFKSHLISSTLTLPPLKVDDSTISLLFNMAAYEMCSQGPSDYRIMSYICLMDSFINHADDVKWLRKRRTLINHLGSDKELAQLFNGIGNDLIFDPYAYADVKWQIENHCKNKARVWIGEWMHDHFSSPWAFLASLGVIFVIALTMVQTYFTVFPP